MTEPRDPAWDPDVRARVHRAANNILFTVADMLTRYGDEDGMYVPPSEVTDAGDVTGLLAAADNQLAGRLQTAVDEWRDVVHQIRAEIDAHRRQVIGEGYRRSGQPPP